MSDPQDFYINHLPPYQLGTIAAQVVQARLSGRDVIDLSQVNPDQGPISDVVDKLVQAILRQQNHRYSSSQGILRLREAICKWYKLRFGVELNAEKEVVVTLGTKEGLSHLMLALLSAGDNVLVPTPCYPIHSAGVYIAGGGFIGFPLFATPEDGINSDFHLTAESDGFFERLQLALRDTWPRPKLLIINFPHNPTSTTVDLSFLSRLVEIARSAGIYIIHDFAYADLAFSGHSNPSILQVPGAKDVAVEFYSLSKGFGLPGWRVGFALGNAKLVGALKKIKSYLDFGLFQPLQIAAVEALRQGELVVGQISSVYELRATLLRDGLTRSGWQVAPARSTPFLWARVPESVLINRASTGISQAISLELLEAGVAVCPGSGFGAESDGFIRFSLVADEVRLAQAVEIINRTVGAIEEEASNVPRLVNSGVGG